MPRYFFDTSALVKHYRAENGTDAVDRIIDEEGAELLIARLTLVETVSAFATKVRTGEFDALEFARLRGLLATHVAHRRYQVFRLLNSHYDRARVLIANHGLARQIRTLDSLQLSLALCSDFGFCSFLFRRPSRLFVRMFCRARSPVFWRQLEEHLAPSRLETSGPEIGIGPGQW